MDMSSIMSAFEGTKAIYNGIQVMLDLKETVAVEAKAAELLRLVTDTQSKLFLVQADYAAAASRIRDLESDVVRLEEWQQEKDRYALHELAPGTFVYRVKPAMQGTEPVHDLCPACYQKGVKGILNNAGFEQAHRAVRCAICSTTFLAERVDTGVGVSIPPPPRPRRPF